MLREPKQTGLIKQLQIELRHDPEPWPEGPEN